MFDEFMLSNRLVEGWLYFESNRFGNKDLPMFNKCILYGVADNSPTFFSSSELQAVFLYLQGKDALRRTIRTWANHESCSLFVVGCFYHSCKAFEVFTAAHVYCDSFWNASSFCIASTAIIKLMCLLTLKEDFWTQHMSMYIIL